MTTDTGYVDLSAVYEGNTFTKRFTISKTKSGIGQDATAYWLISPAAIVKKQDGTFEPSNIKICAMSQTGDSNVISYAGKFTIEESEDGILTSDEAFEIANYFIIKQIEGKWQLSVTRGVLLP